MTESASTPTPFAWTVPAALLTAIASALLGVTLLNVLPFLAQLDALGSNRPTATQWAGFVVGAFVLGGLCGLTSLIPLKAVRLAVVIPLVGVAASLMAQSAGQQTLSSMHSGDSLLALILLSPFLLALGAAYILLVAALMVAIVVGAGLLKDKAQPLPTLVQAVGVAIGVAASFVVLQPSVHALASAPPRPKQTRLNPPPERPIPPCEAPPFSVAMGRSALTSAFEVLPSQSAVQFYVTIGQSDWTPKNILDAADSALNGHRQCLIGSAVWTPRVQLAQPRPITLHLRVARNRHMKRDDQKMMLESHIASAVRSGLRSDSAAPQYFVTKISEWSTPDPSVQLLGCEPVTDDLICERDRISFRVPGVYPTLADIKVDWDR
jgi:hypothetical protein